MKKYLRHALSITLMLVAFTMPAMADSPLTSTSWWKYYENKSIVTDASEYGCTEDVMKALSNPKYSIDMRLAIVNAISWNFNGQSNYLLFCDYLKEHQGIKAVQNPTAETLCVMAYLKAMDNYFDVDDALKMARKAHQMKPRSRAIAVIYGLISAQKAMDSDWSKVWTCVAQYAYDSSLTPDMSDYAISQIMEYIDLYKSEY